MVKEISRYLSRNVYPFHMPGHKQNPLFFPPHLQSLDLTEIPGMDVLSSATGIIQKMQDRIASFYHADASFFLVNGSSAGVMAAVCYAATVADLIMMPRNAHVSAYNALGLSDMLPRYIMPEISLDGLAGGISPALFNDMPHGAAVLIVSPTYEGFVSDISAIAHRVHEKNGIVIVDEAHGAHFPFHKGFPASALENGADIVVNSFHKTLPALSQTAALHVKKERIDVKRLQFFVNAMQTSSPSYMFMASTDYMLQLLWDSPTLFDEYFERLCRLRASLASFGLLGKERIGKDAVFDVDIGKLLFSVENARDIAEILSKKYQVQMEMAAGQHMLGMTSVADTNEGFQLLEHAIKSLKIKPPTKIFPCLFSPPEAAITPYEALRQPSKKMPLENATGKISAQLIAEYPPGIALIAPGERIPQDICHFTKKMSHILVVDN